MHDEDSGNWRPSAYRGKPGSMEALRYKDISVDVYNQTGERQGPKNDSMGPRSAH